MSATTASAQTVVRRVGAIGDGRDSVVVSASDIGMISTVVFVEEGVAPAIATARNTRAWMQSADSISRLPTATLGDGAKFAPVPLTAMRGTMAYVRTIHSSAAPENALSSQNGGVETSLALTDKQFNQLLALVAQAADATDSMTVASGHVADSTAKSDGGHTPGIYFEFQVEKQARPDLDTRPPHYPDLLRAQRLEGSVLAQFVVDTTGQVEMSTFKVVNSTHDLFTSAVKDALSTMRFSPAIAGGMKVRQLVEMPFPFNLP
ncbi:MAG TPA: energy transducer TonB [Gemmatimonadaceae bacterium]